MRNECRHFRANSAANFFLGIAVPKQLIFKQNSPATSLGRCPDEEGNETSTSQPDAVLEVLADALMKKGMKQLAHHLVVQPLSLGRCPDEEGIRPATTTLSQYPPGQIRAMMRPAPARSRSPRL
jgi:hypothetical protein